MVEEAETLLCEADSLRVKGIAPTDSVLWAETVAALYPWSIFYPTDYAKANYYYGYLLRTKGHHPQAMQCFIDASKAKTNDHVLLGRVYANMANMCRLEKNYELAYCIYEKSKDQFAKSGNSKMYYYAINNMALQRAFQNDKHASYELLSIVERECNDSAVLTKILETKATACMRVKEYDSVLIYIDSLVAKGFRERPVWVLKAQAFSWLENQDSAMVYAKQVLDMGCTLNDSVNMLYVMTHDKSISSDSLLTLSTVRADRHREYTTSQELLSHAVEIYQQSIKPNYKWIYGVIVTLLFIGIIVCVVLWITRKHRAFKIKQVKTLVNEGKKVLAQTKILNRELIDANNNLLESRLEQFENNCKALRNSHDIKQELQWKDYEAMCVIINKHLFLLANKLKALNILTEKEIRLCILIAIKFSQKEIASILPYSENGIGKFKYTTAKKMGIKAKNLRETLVKMAISA